MLRKEAWVASLVILATFYLILVVPQWNTKPTTTSQSSKIRRSDSIEELPIDNNGTNPYKHILLYTPFYRKSLDSWGLKEALYILTDSALGTTFFVDAGCPVQTCYVTKNRDYAPWSEYDAVIFHFREMEHENLERVMHPSRTQAQRYVMALVESPINKPGENYAKYEGFFNWTMTYLKQSDIYFPYGRILPKEQSEAGFSNVREAHKEILKKKTKMAAWAVSHCHTKSKREEFAKELGKMISIDIFGKCGSFNDTKEGKRDPHTFQDVIGVEYKFYLAFENSFCTDYVTEKFFERIKMDSVLIVYGGADYSEIAPPHSCIDARDFESPKKLADYLKYLDQNDEAYLSYFWWKQSYTVLGVGPARMKSYCQLCEMLHDENQPVNVYRNLGTWWKQANNCKLPKSLD